MLTITAPIELKCKTPGSSMHEGFYHRIADPYTMMTSKLSPEDLLHVVTTPPEYFFGGEEQTNIFQQTNVHAHQENKLEVMNNLINRMMISESAHLTYQDRVYITDILQKIGIHNVNEFMKQVRLIKEEQNQTNQLIDLYWSYAGDLRQLVENYHREQVTEHRTEEHTDQSQTMYLHEHILNRLQTAAIYQTVQNFNTRAQGDQNITNTQLQVSEQYGLAQQILLQKLKNEARGEETPLTYRYENYYENQQLSEEQINEQNVLTQVSSAVLLDLVNNVYRSREERQSSRVENWYHMERSFYQNAENTMQRIENSMSSRYQTDQTVEQLSVSHHQELRRQEIAILNRLFEPQGSDQYQTVNELLYQDINNRNLVNRMIEQMDEQQLIEQIEQLNQTNYYDDHSSQIVRRLLDQKNIQIEQINSPILRRMIEQQLYETRNEQYGQPQVQLTNIEHQQGDHLQEENYFEQTQQMPVSEHRTEYHHTTQLHQEATEVQNRYQQTVEGIRETIARTAARAQEEHAEGAQPPDVNVTEQVLQTQLQTELSEQNVYADHSIHEQTQNIDQRDLSSVEQELSRINRENINNQSKYIQMMEGIRESLASPKETRSPEQMRRESLMALEHPAELLEQLQEEGEQQHQAQQEKLTHVMNLLPEQTREVYETVREYLEAPQQVRRQMEGVTDDIGVLVRDLHEAQVVQEQTELVHRQQERIQEQTREVIDRWQERTSEQPQTKQVYEDQRTDVTLVHRSQEQQLDEEEIRQLIEQNRTQTHTVHTQNESVTNYDTTQRQFTNVNTQQIMEQTENVSELVRQGVQRELGALSEKIYHKLEKRLEAEKRRRGY